MALISQFVYYITNKSRFDFSVFHFNSFLLGLCLISFEGEAARSSGRIHQV